ncbi:MAG: SIS domain-containing protein [Gemmatimonadota bacterium]
MHETGEWEPHDPGDGRTGAAAGEATHEASVIRGGLLELAGLAGRAGRDLAGPAGRVARLTTEALRGGGKLLFCGNGGSAADAQHLAAEYVVRFRRDRPGLAALALTTDTSVLTAGANDFGFGEVFARQVQALGREGDVLFLHSTSGESENLLRAAEVARAAGIVTVGLLARGGGRLRERVDHALVVPTDVTAHAQELHLALGHLICDLVDGSFAERSSGDPAEGGDADPGGST